MEYAIMGAVCFVGGFFGAVLGGRRDKDTPLPVESVFKKAVKKVKGTTDTQDAVDPKVYGAWLFHPRSSEVE